MMLLQIFCALIVICVLGVNCQEPEVEIPQGRLVGRTRINRDGGTFYSFQNIPFAKPPLDELRFKAPQPADGWEGTRDATRDLPTCVSVGATLGQEDCLYLNIYTPELPAENAALKPVMVFIYGGAFNSGSASETMYGAQFLLTKDIVLVIPNYRVGIFGFLNFDDPEVGIPGNAGMKDQVLALQWINNNIEHFGGDPNNILIFGESAGSMSVHLHLLSPMSAGLFHKAISQSGESTGAINSLVFRNTGELIAEALGIQTENKEEMLASLQSVSATALSIAESMLTPDFGLFSTPIVEKASNELPFLQEEPIDIIRSGNYNRVPFIIGVNDAEGLLWQLFARQATGENMLLTDFAKFIPPDLEISAGSEEEEVLSAKIKYFYYGDSEPSRDNITAAVQLHSDRTFIFPSYRTVVEYLKTVTDPIYFYYFTSITRLNFLKMLDETLAAYPGAAHADELGYLFRMILIGDVEEGSVEDLAIKNMVNLWTNFAIYGHPTPEGFSYIWEPVREDRFNYLHIATEASSMDVDPVPERMQFWWNLYEEYFPGN